MRRVDAHTAAASVPRPSILLLLLAAWQSALSHIWTRIIVQPAIVFVLLSLAFGSAIILVMPPLRGPDEIAHFLRIYSYTRGELLPAAEIDGRKGIFVERDLHDQLHFFKAAGEWFAAAREDGARYGQVMAMYQEFGGKTDDTLDQVPIFMPFAGSDGYNPAAYIPYIIAGAIGRGLGLDFPDMLLLIRLFGLATFTAVAAYAIAVTPVLKWAFILVALLPVSIYNRSVLSADGAAFSSALLITALCLSAAWKGGNGRLWERSLSDDSLRAQQAATNRLRAVGANDLPILGGSPADGVASRSSCSPALFCRHYG